jgi:hypothetical protein
VNLEVDVLAKSVDKLACGGAPPPDNPPGRNLRP